MDAGIQRIGSSEFERIDFAPFAPGLVSIESVGDSVALTKLGPFQWIHDAFYSPGSSIPHHPHDKLEHLMLVVEGEAEHDDSRNGIHGTAGAGDFVRMTNGTKGVVHSERNARNDALLRVLMLIHEPDANPPIEEPSYETLRAADAPTESEADGVTTRHLIGGRSTLGFHHSQLRSIAETTLAVGTSVHRQVPAGSGLLVYPLTGTVVLSDADGSVPSLASTTDGREGPDAIAVIWTDDSGRTATITAETDARVLTAEWSR